MFEKWIGYRTLKTSIAVAIAIKLAQLLGFEYPFFAGMTAIISMDKTALLSIKMARNRILGTMLGALIGVVLSTVFFRGSALLCGVGVIILIGLCKKFKLENAIGIGGIVMFGIMIHTDKTPLFYGFHRSSATILGGLVAVVVNMSLFPLQNLKYLESMLHRIWNLSSKLIDATREESKNQLEEIHDELADLRTQLSVYEGEKIFKAGRELVDRCTKEMNDLEKLYTEVDVLFSVDKNKYPEIFNYHYNRAVEIYSESFNDFK